MLNKSDRYHEWAVQQWQNVKAPAITCEAVISETCFLLKSTYLQEIAMAMIEAGAIATRFHLEGNIARVK